MAYTRAAVERVMKAPEAILRALSGRQSWLQVAHVLGVSPRTVRAVGGCLNEYSTQKRRRLLRGPEAAPSKYAVVRWNALECARVRHKLGTNSDPGKFSGGQLFEMNGGLGRD